MVLKVIIDSFKLKRESAFRVLIVFFSWEMLIIVSIIRNMDMIRNTNNTDIIIFF